MPRVRKIVIFANLDKPHAQEMAEAIIAKLLQLGFIADLHSSLRFCDHPALEGAELAISLGGDGTVLATARYVSSWNIPIFPINLGNFGFITEFGKDDWEGELVDYLAATPRFNERLMLAVAVERSGMEVFRELALNDVVVTGAGISKLIKLQLSLEKAVLGIYRADGMIIATPTGSTAYSAAAGGPILSPGMAGIIVNPICPFTLSHRPVVLPATETITVAVYQQQRSAVLLTVDGQITFGLEEGDVIKIKTAPQPARIAYCTRRNFYDVLRTKLNWSGGPDA